MRVELLPMRFGEIVMVIEKEDVPDTLGVGKSRFRWPRGASDVPDVGVQVEFCQNWSSV